MPYDEKQFTLCSVGLIRSPLRVLEEAPRQGQEGAPDAWLDIEPSYVGALKGITPGDSLFLITFLHRADREALQTHPRNDPSLPVTGVFATRSPDRPNPLGLHRVAVKEIDGPRLRVGPIEAIDGTPVVDIKPVLPHEV